MNAINEEPEHRGIEALLRGTRPGTLGTQCQSRAEQALAGDRELARRI